jgi:hypothetical protein
VTSDALHPDVENLARRAFGSATRVVSIEPLAGDASSRSYFRAALAGDAPATVIVMVQPGSGLPISSDELAVFDEPPKEMPFLSVQRYLRRIGVAVPEVFARQDDRGLVLLEDIGDLTLWDAARTAPAARAETLYSEAIDELVRMQREAAEHPDASCLAFRQRFDARLFLWEFDHFIEYGFGGRTVEADDTREMRRHFETMSEELAADSETLAHRDYHSWNLFVHRGRIRVIDFQDALVAPVPYDLATLLNDRATPHVVTPPLERKLASRFLGRRAAWTGEDADVDRFLPRYYRFVLQKALKVVGRFHYLEEVKGKRGYLEMLPDTIATVRRAFENLPDLAPLRRVFARSFPEVA